MKRILTVMLVLVMLFTIAGCGGTKTTTPTEKDGAEETTKSTTKTEDAEQKDESLVIEYSILEKEDHPQGIAMMTFKDKLEDISNGQIRVEAFPNGVLYTQEAATTALTTGDLGMSHVSVQFVAQYLPKVSMFAAPYMFKNYDHMRVVMDSEIGDNLRNDIAVATGITPLVIAYNGSRQLNLRSDTPVNKPEDLQNIILRMPDAEDWIIAGESIGAKVAPLAFGEVYTALQTGMIDAQDNPLPTVEAMKFYEVTKQISMTTHLIDLNLISISSKVLEQVSDQQRQWIYEAAEAAKEAVDAAMLEGEENLIEFFKDEGLIITHPDIDAFQEYSYTYYVDNGHTSSWDMDLYNQIQEKATK